MNYGKVQWNLKIAIESSVRRMQHFSHLVIMRRSRFFCEKRGMGCLRASFVCRGGVGDSEVLYRLFYHVNLIDFNLPGGGGCRPRSPPLDTHILIRDNLKRQYFKFFTWSSFVSLSKKRLSMTGSKHPADKPDRKSCSVCSRYYLFSKIK